MKAVKCPNCIVSQTIHKFTSNKFQIYFCRKCLNGFTYPVPEDLSKYYSDTYWLSEGFLGPVKNMLYTLFQTRRKYWVQKFLKKGNILDVGSGEGIFSKLLKKNLIVTSLDVPTAKIKNPDVLKVDFLKWNPKKKFDAIVFWESLEHTISPQKYINKAARILRNGGLIFIEYPRVDCWEARFFRNYWFHLDPPRHLSHLTPSGVNKLLSRARLTTISCSGVLAFEYAIGGLIESILNIFRSGHSDFFKNSNNFGYIFLLIPLIGISAFIETILYIIGQSPIYLTIAKKST